MEEQDLLHLILPGYILGSSLCHQNLQQGGVCIFVRRDPYFSKINILCNCKENYLEICAVEQGTKSELHTLSLYTVSMGDFNQFIKNLDDVLTYLYKPKAELLNLWRHKHRLSH